MRRKFEIVLVVLAISVAAIPLPRSAVEHFYSRGAYPIIQPALTAFSNRTSITLFDLVLLAVVFCLLAIWILGWRARSDGKPLRTVAGLVLDTAAVASILYLWFLAAWGLNYQREPLRTRLDFEDARITDERLRELAIRDVDALNALHEAAHKDGWLEFSDLPAALGPAFSATLHDLAISGSVRNATPKRSMLDYYFRRVAVDGMTDPFFLETLANQGLLPLEKPFVVAHEWGHLAGFADESEANFIAWLVCTRGRERERYSGWISLYGTIVSALPTADRQSVVERLQPGPQNDLRAIDERVSREVNRTASRAGYAMYDRFLKANRVEAGIRSYSEVIRLLLGTRFTDDGAPVLTPETKN